MFQANVRNEVSGMIIREWLSGDDFICIFLLFFHFDLIYTSQLSEEFDLLLCFVQLYSTKKKFRELCLKGSNKKSKTFEEI